MAAQLGRVAQQLRDRAGLTLMDIAVAAEVGQSTIHRFEAGDGWRRETDAIVDAYAECCGVPARDIWLAAITLDA